MIDESDHERVAAFKWYAVASGKTFYARATGGPIASPLMGMHSFILKVKHGIRVDHKDGNGLNNTRDNLRIASPVENSRNTFKSSSPATSKFKGVIRNSGGQYCASITMLGEHQIIGIFEDEEEAARAYDLKAIELFGEFAKTNEMMGLFENDKPIRSNEGLHINTSQIGPFKGADPSDMVPWRKKVGDREPVGTVVALSRHHRTKMPMYRLDTGAVVHIKDYLGVHPSAEEMEQMRIALSQRRNIGGP
jgi:hypothetical protein